MSKLPDKKVDLEEMEHEVVHEHAPEKFDFGFFRRYQKAILYTAGIFALVTFSITGAMTSAFGSIFSSSMASPTMSIAGREIKVTTEDYEVAKRLARWSAPVLALPRIADDEETRSHDNEVWAALRRLAIESGIEGSEVEAEKAVKQAMSIMKAGDDMQRFAFGTYGMSKAQLLHLTAEALRVGTFLRLQALAIDTSDATIAEEIVNKQEYVTLQVASFDKKAIEKTLKEAKIADDDLKAWLASLTEAEKIPYQDANRVALRVAGLGYAEADPAAFEAELKGKTWSDEQVRQRYDLDKETRYKIEPASRPSTATQTTRGSQSSPTETRESAPTRPSYIEFETVKAQIQKEFKLEDALRAIWTRVQEDMAAHLRPQVDARAKAGETLATARKKQTEAQKAYDEAKAKLEKPAADAWATAEKEQKDAIEAARKAVEPLQTAFNTAQDKLEKKQKDAWTESQKRIVDDLEKAKKAVDEARRAAAAKPALAPAHDEAKAKVKALEAQLAAGAPQLAEKYKPLDEAKKKLEALEKALARGPKELAAQADALDAAKAAIEPLEHALRDAEYATDQARKLFDAHASFNKHLAGRAGSKLATIPEPKSADGLKELPGIGKWADSSNAISIDSDGDLATQLQRNPSTAFFFQVTQVQRRPVKEFADIKEKLTSDYAAKKADEKAREAGERMSAALLRLGKEAKKSDVEKIEKEQAEAAAKKFTDWKSALDATQEKANKNLAIYTDPHSRAHKEWAKKLDDVKKQLADDAAQRQKIAEETKTETESKLEEAAKKAYQQILKTAADEAGFTVKQHGPYLRNLDSQPRFNDRYGDDVKFLFRDAKVKELKAGEATGLLEDMTGRALHVVTCESVVKGTLAQLTRRQLLAEKEGLAAKRIEQGVAQSFSYEALKSRYGWKPPAGSSEEKTSKKPESRPSTGSAPSTGSRPASDSKPTSDSTPTTKK